MVKIHCDKCGAEIKEGHYYTIVIGKAELNPKYEYSISDCASAISAYNREPEKSPFEQLNSQQMYCKDCKDKVESYLWSNTDSSLA